MLAVGCEEVSLGTGTCRVVLDLMMSSRRNAGRLLEESAAAEVCRPWRDDDVAYCRASAVMSGFRDLAESAAVTEWSV